MEAFKWKKPNCRIILALTSVICTVGFRGVDCQGNTISYAHNDDTKLTGMKNVRGDNIPPTPEAAKPQTVIELSFATGFPAFDNKKSTAIAPTVTHITSQPQRTSDAVSNDFNTRTVMCVDEAAVRDKDAVKLKLRTVSSCEENKAKIQSVLEHLCVDGSKLEIYQEDHTNEMILSGECVEADVKGMTEKFDNDNIKDKVGILEAESVVGNHSQTVLISILIAGLLLAALLIAAYILKTRQTEAKGARLDEEMFQVDEQNQGNTLLSVAPLPPQEPVDKPTSNGESVDSPPTNGHSATAQTPDADSEM